MASWNDIAEEINQLERPDAIDVVRRQKLQRLQEITDRPVVLYASDFSGQNLVKSQVAGNWTLISLSDKQGFDEVTRNLHGDNLDVILHSPGGSAEATESIVELLRARFSHIRFIIPDTAKSAATMMAMSGNQLLMDERSELGPTDPQMVMQVDNRFVTAPAQAIKDQFATAQKQIENDPNSLPSWLPLLRLYGPSLLAECDNHLALAEELVAQWLQTYMFADDVEGPRKARRLAEYLRSHNEFRSHSRRIGMLTLQAFDVNILDMRTVPELHEAVRDVYTALSLTFIATNTVKIFENNQNETLAQQITVQPDTNQPPSVQPDSSPTPEPQPAPVQRSPHRQQPTTHRHSGRRNK